MSFLPEHSSTNANRRSIAQAPDAHKTPESECALRSGSAHRKATARLSQESTLVKLEVSSKQTLHVVGDLHGQFWDLLHILEMCGEPGACVLGGQIYVSGEMSSTLCGLSNSCSTPRVPGYGCDCVRGRGPFRCARQPCDATRCDVVVSDL